MVSIETPAGEVAHARWGGPAERPVGGRTSGWATFGKAAVAAVLIAVILRDVRFSEVLAAIGGADLRIVAAALMLNFVGLGIAVTRWQVLLRAQGTSASAGTLFVSCIVAIFFNNLLPSTIGGDAVRIYDSWKLGVDKGRAVTVVFVDRFLGLFAVLLFAMFGVGFLRQSGLAVPHVTALVIGCTAVAVIVLTLLFGPAAQLLPLQKLKSRLPTGLAMRIRTKILDPLFCFRGRIGALMHGLGLSLLLQANVVLFYFLIGAALALPVSLVAFFIIIPFALFVMMIPISINGVGLREGAFVVLLGLYGVGKPEALAFAWIAYGLVLLQGVMGGLVYAARK